MEHVYIISITQPRAQPSNSKLKSIIREETSDLWSSN